MNENMSEKAKDWSIWVEKCKDKGICPYCSNKLSESKTAMPYGDTFAYLTTYYCKKGCI